MTNEGAGLKKILVTGGTGFIGAYLLQELIMRSYRVKALHRSDNFPFFIPKNILEQVEWVKGDVLDVVSLGEAMQDCDAVIHSAAIVSFLKKYREQMYRVNVEGTANVVNMALENNIPRLVHVSSVAAVGRTTGGETVNETKKWTAGKQHTHYAISKHRAEIEVYRGIAEGLSAVIVNPSTVLGFGNWNQSSNKIFKNVYNGFSWFTSGLNGFVGVEDVARVTVQLMNTSISGERFIVNSDNWRFKKLFETIAQGFNKKPPHREASAWMGELAWRLEKLKSIFTQTDPLLTAETARVAQSETRFDNTKILEILPGFNFTPLDQTIVKACSQYEQAIKNGDLS